MPKPRRPHVASPDEVKITRAGEYAVIAYADDAVATTHLELGSEKLARMTDAEILEFWNNGIRARDEFMAEQELAAIEIPMGKRQLRYEERSDQWVPRGDVVKGIVLDATGNEDLDEQFVTIDGRDFSIREFVRMLSPFASWGFRLVFVPDENIHEEPTIEVREPEDR
ncbi:MAG TPA: hypothetical protein VGI10_28395 [Polyangiaceae bacterium]|jgi:hypothetical protein